MINLLVVFGTRPEAIKLAPLVLKLREQFKVTVCVTGQHREMLNQALQIFGIEADSDLRLMQPNQDLASLTSGVLRGIYELLEKDNYDGVIVQGDTTSSMAAAMAAFYHKIPVAHVEAGLRSYNQSMPEEINRLITDHLSTLLFCPTNNSVKNLEKEGVTKGVFVSGDVMYDAFINFNKEIVNRKDSFHKLGSNYILATIHRPENTDFKKKLISIFSSLDKLNRKKRVVMPLHPRTRKKVLEYNITTKINILPPQGYLSMLSLLNDSELVITDSGGLQKEAFFAKKKCITIRNETEWVELIDSNTNILSKPNNVIDSYYEVLNNKCNFSSQIFGNGNASEFVINSIMDYFKN